MRWTDTEVYEVQEIQKATFNSHYGDEEIIMVI